MKNNPDNSQTYEATVSSLTHEGKGVCKVEGKTIFVDGALPGEKIRFKYRTRKRKFDEAELVDVIEASPHRVTAKCAHFGLCGGCSLMHLDAEEQIKQKQAILLENLQHIGHTQPTQIIPAITGPAWGYRRKARLGVKFVKKKGKVLVGFREKRSPFLAELEQCEVLHPCVGQRLLGLAALIQSLDCYNQIAQIEVAVTDAVCALVFRNLVPLSDADKIKLTEYAQQQDVAILLQPAGPDSVSAFYPEQIELSYTLAEYAVTLHFSATDFVQVNQEINPKMVHQALELLDLQADDEVLELFCGLGNFSLPMARTAKHVTGVEGSRELVEKARHNAQLNNLSNLAFHVANLMEDVSASSWIKQPYSKLLLDPPRSGAKEIMPLLGKLKIKHIVYVSCNPATLARDADILVNELGYTLQQAGVMDMFPHTAHVESIALFVKQK